MMRTIPCFILAAALACAATDAAAQPVAGAFEVPPGEWEYRWVTRADAQGNVTREPATGFLRLRPGGMHTHLRDAGGTRMSTTGQYRVDGATLYLPHANMDGGRMQVDTFGARHISDRLYLWQQQGAETLEYTLAPPGAPVEPAVVPGLIPSIHAFVQSVLFFESDGGPMPRPQRRYATEFHVDSVRYMNVQIDLSHPITLADRTLPVVCTFEHVGLGASYDLEWPGQIRSGKASSGLSTGMGTAEPGNWRPGTYRVRCTVDGVPVPEAGFVIR